jgi:tRNA(fMet)-specific endonuclease VapC
VDIYFLDTDICSYVMKRSNQQLLDKLRDSDPSKIAISVVTEAELLFGIRLSAKPKVIRDSFDGFVRHVQVFTWGRDAAEHYADIRAALRVRGELIGSNDLMIAAHVRSVDATLVTNNVREFGRVPGLMLENWTV